MFVLFKEPRYNILGVRRLFLAVSLVGIAAGVFACVKLWNGTANLGTDFGGGVLLHLSAGKDLPLEEVRGSLDGNGWTDAQIQRVQKQGDTGFRMVIRIRRSLETGVGTLGTQVVEALGKSFPGTEVRLDGSEEVGPAVSAKLRNDAYKAFLISVFGILIYIAFRFDFRFGVISVVATVHDILLTLAVVVLGGLEFNLLTITAILTISGYSLNDTVVIFDRIRENLKNLGRQSYLEMVNTSLNETLNRTIITGGSTLLALLPVYLIGGDVLHEFSLTLILGILIGTYSSIFVAAALLAEWHLMSSSGAKSVV